MQAAAKNAHGSGFDNLRTAVEVSLEVPNSNKYFVFDGFRAEDQEKMRKITVSPRSLGFQRIQPRGINHLRFPA